MGLPVAANINIIRDMQHPGGAGSAARVDAGGRDT